MTAISTSPHFDVIVVGGGPAGATVATLVADRGHRVLLLERSGEPRFKIGESLMPASYWIFERLGLLERMRASAFPVKESVQFFTADGRASTPFYFQDHDPHESSCTWQVLRSDFDELLLENAAAKGAEVRRGRGVERVLFDDHHAVGIRMAGSSSPERDLRCRVVVDATGQASLLGRQLQIRELDPRLKKASIFTHVVGARRDGDRNAGATLIFHTRDRNSWFWFIPLPEDRVSVGVVGSIDYLIRDRQGDPQHLFEEELEICPALNIRLRNARQILPVQVVRDFSYQLARMAGDGWVVAGDAAGFIDPIYSTGVFLALKSGEMAADAICDALERGDLSASRLSVFEPELRQGMAAMRILVHAFYDPNFHFSSFLRQHPECRGELVDLLMGNVFRRPMARLLEALDETLHAASARLETGSAR